MVAEKNTKIREDAVIQLEKDKEKYIKDVNKKEDAYQQKVAARGVVFEAYCFLVID